METLGSERPFRIRGLHRIANRTVVASSVPDSPVRPAFRLRGRIGTVGRAALSPRE